MMLNGVPGEVGGNIQEYDIDDIDLVRANEGIAFDDDDRSEISADADGDDYGGMAVDVYNSIVEYKRSGIMPPGIDKRIDRSAHSHWRSRCQRFAMADDQETLLYFNPTSPVNDQPKIVVKKGEVRKVLERIHELIGHLGQKRTQIVVLKKLHWRSVRVDVRHYINMCSFCNQKKLEGRKIIKAPVDITSDNFDINVSIRENHTGNGDRLEFSLVGYNEDEVRTASLTRMTSYTFKETTSEYRSRFASPNSFRRQPYVKRERTNQYAVGYLVPFNQRGRHIQPEFIEIFERQNIAYPENVDGEEYEQVVEEIVEPMGMNELVDASDMVHGGGVASNEVVSEVVVTDSQHIDNQCSSTLVPESEPIPVQFHGRPLNVKREFTRERTASNASIERIERNEQDNDIEPTSSTTPRRYSVKRENRISEEQFVAAPPKKRRRDRPIQGAAGRFCLTTTSAETERISELRPSELLAPVEGSHSRPELLGLPPICLMPTADPQVAQLQRELLTRQINIQKMQEKVLQAQYEASMRIPMTRYSHVQQEHPHHEQVEEPIEVEHLNVIDDEDRVRVYPQHSMQ